MKLFFILCAALLSLSVSAQAQDSILPGQQQQEREQTIDEQLGITQPNQRPKQRSTGDIKKDYSLRFHDECIKTSHRIISPESRELLCACTAQDMQKNMPFGDMVALFEDKAKAPRIYRNILRTYYAGCTKHPARDTAYDLCMQSDALKETGKLEDTCKCTADTVARYMTANGRQLMGAQLDMNPNLFDPLGNYLESSMFISRYRMYLDRCIEIHVWGYR